MIYRVFALRKLQSYTISDVLRYVIIRGMDKLPKLAWKHFFYQPTHLVVDGQHDGRWPA